MKLQTGVCLMAIMLNVCLASALFGLEKKLTEEEMKQKDMFNGDASEPKATVTQMQNIAPTTEVDYIQQVGGLDTDDQGNLVIFHRGSRKWGIDSFIGNKFNPKYGPIKENVLDVIDTDTLENLGSWGAGRFYMPHGVTLDVNGNLWLTDVGTHQVYKYNLRKSNESLLTLGVKFETGDDSAHFCKPTDVAVAEKTGDIFVSDGYCNSRIVQFDKHGKYIREFKDAINPIQVSHSIALIERLGLICGASRQDGRICCFDIATGKESKAITHKNMRNVYAIEYDAFNDVLHAISGDRWNQDEELGTGLTFNVKEAKFGEVISIWKNQGMKHAHDIAISPDSSRIYVGELDGKIVEFLFN